MGVMFSFNYKLLKKGTSRPEIFFYIKYFVIEALTNGLYLVFNGTKPPLIYTPDEYFLISKLRTLNISSNDCINFENTLSKKL